jgi:hypothetical protein
MKERFVILNKNDNYNDLGFSFETLKQAKSKIKELKEFDKREGNPFNEEYIIKKEVW